MKNIKRKILSATLALSMAFSVSTPAFATNGYHAEKVQVKYDVSYIDNDTENQVMDTVTKIDFSGNTIREKAPHIRGYRVVGENIKTVKLKKGKKTEVVFRYRDVQKDKAILDEAKGKAVNSVDSLKYLDDSEKNDYIRKINSAQNTDVVKKVQKNAERANRDNRPQIKYQVKFVEKETDNEIAESVVKIDFDGRTVSEKAVMISGYKLVSEGKKSILLDASKENVIVFEYEKKEDGYSELNAAKEDAINTVQKKLGWLKKSDRDYYIRQIKKARTPEAIERIEKDAAELNEKRVPVVTYTVQHINAETGEVLDSTRKIDFAGQIVEEKAEKFKELGLISPEKQQIVLKNKESNVIIFRYKSYDDPDIPLQEFLKEKINYNLPLVYKNTDFTGHPELLKDYLLRKMHNGDTYANFTCTKEEQEYVYKNLFDKSTRAGAMRYVRNWTDADDVADRTKPHKFNVGFTYDEGREKMQHAEDMMYGVVEKYIRPDMSDYEKVKTIHDYVINHSGIAVNPDGSAKHNLENGQLTNNPVAVMIDGKGVCEGYSMTFNRLAELAGVESILVTGRYVPGFYFSYYKWDFEQYSKSYDEQMLKGTFKMNHAWNLVKINGKWYHLDVFHDDYNETNNPDTKQSYEYFLRSDEYMHTKTCRFWDRRYTEKAESDYKTNQRAYYPMIHDFE